MDVERLGDGADGLPVTHEFPRELLLVGQHFLWPAKDHAARLSCRPTILCSTENEDALELFDAGETGSSSNRTESAFQSMNDQQFAGDR